MSEQTWNRELKRALVVAFLFLLACLAVFGGMFAAAKSNMKAAKAHIDQSTFTASASNVDPTPAPLVNAPRPVDSACPYGTLFCLSESTTKPAAALAGVTLPSGLDASRKHGMTVSVIPVDNELLD